MGKILISEDKRTVWYLSACAALFAASAYFVATRLDDALLRVKISIGSIGCFAIMAMAIVAIYLIVLSRMILIIKFTGSGIKYGFCAKREIQYSEICRVDTKDGLEIHLQDETRRIRVLGLSQNEEEYTRLLKAIDDNTEVDAQPQNHINRLKKTAYDPERRKWLRDTLLFIFIYLLMTLLDNVIFVFMVVSMDFAQMIFPAELILHNILLLWGLTAAVFMAGKHKRAPFLIITYFWAYFAVAVASYVFAHFRPYIGEPEKISLAEYIIRSAMLVCFALFASRYEDKSETAQSVLSDEGLFLKSETGRKNNRRKIKSKGLILFTLACLALGAFMTWVANVNMQYYYHLDKVRYSSPGNVIEQKYKGAQGGYLSAGNYHLIYAENTVKGFIDDNVYYETEKGEILFLNGWHEETYDNLSKSEYFDCETESDGNQTDLMGRVEIYAHDKYFIVAINVRDRSESPKDIEVYGNSQEFDKAKISDTSEFLKVIEISEGTPDYLITVTADGGEIYSATFKDIIED